jgi:hypothetical protein
MERFGMVESSFCDNCPTTLETIKHLIWDCPRARNTWNYVNDLLTPKIGYYYITYESIFLGNERPIYAAETIIVWCLRKVISIERTTEIRHEYIKNLIETLFRYEQASFGKDSIKFRGRWKTLITLF